MIVADAIMIILLLKNSTSYFRPYRDYFVAIYCAFTLFPVRDLFVIFLPDQQWALQVSTHAMIGGATTIALLWGHLATRLYLYPAPFSLRYALRKPSRPIQYVFMLYMVPLAVTLVASFVLPGAVADKPVTANYLISGGNYSAISYSPEFLALAASVIVAFVSYPFLVLSRLRSQLKDPEVRYALRVIAFCFGIISVLLLATNALDTFRISITGVGSLVSVSLLIVVDRAFSKPSFLKAFLGVVPTLESQYANARAEMRVLVYRRDEKFGPISRFVNEGVSQEGLVVYFYRGDAVTVREGLARNGFNTRQYLIKRNLRMVPFSSLYQSEGTLDKEAALGYVGELAEEARALGKKSLRLVIDYEDYTERPSAKFVDHLIDPRWTSPDHYVSVLMVFSEAAFQGQEAAMSLLKKSVDTADLTDLVDSFSRTVGLSHSEIAGKKILLEYDPLSDYEKILESLLTESASNFERSVLFTRKDSPVFSTVRDQTRAKMFILTSRVSYPKMEEENRVLLPAYDSSLLLDALDKTIQAYAGASFTIIFDGISHFVFTLGPDRAFSLVRQALELMVSNKVTAIFLLNAAAHEPKVVSTFENLFDMELVSTAGARIPQVKRRLNVMVEP